jgi:hypothetical protein
MTGDQSRKLKVGDRVCWHGTATDKGTVSEVDWTGVTIKWDTGDSTTLLHNDMGQVDWVPMKL